MSYPIQPIIEDNYGVIRFEKNPIIDWLCTAKSDMNEIAIFVQENNTFYTLLTSIISYTKIIRKFLFNKYKIYFKIFNIKLLHYDHNNFLFSC